jgi:hypothetical protein
VAWWGGGAWCGVQWGGDSDVTLRGRHQCAGNLSGGMDGGGVREIYGFRPQHAVYIFRLLWCDKEQAVGVVNWINNVLAVLASVAADFLFSSCLLKLFSNSFCLLKISYIVVFLYMTSRKYP